MRRTIASAVAAFMVAGPPSAQDAESEFAAGQAEYVAACAACHGEAADGNGPLATMFRTRVPDLTGLASRNGGEFPLLRVIHLIDGRATVRGHGNPMPVFGQRYRTEIGEGAGPFGSEAIVRARVLELALYLSGIQR